MKPKQPVLRVCFVQAYRAPDYIRGRSIRLALQGTEVLEAHMAVNNSSGLVRYAETVGALMRIRRETDPDAYILGFRGHEIGWLVRFLTRGKPLVLDAMMSPYSGLTEEGKLGWLGRRMAPLWRHYEKWVLQRVDGVLTDTGLHARYYQETFGIPADKLLCLPIGAIESGSAPARHDMAEDTEPQPFRVLFYGSFLPLHGIDVIVDAASRLTDLPIEFRFIGGNRRQSRRLHEACRRGGVTNYLHEHWLPFDRLLQEEIPQADLCLGGPFGGTPQARRVVTGKTSQCLASGRATVVGRIDEDTGFIGRENCLLVEQQDAASLADAIRWAHDHRDRLPAIGLSGRRLYQERFSTQVVAAKLVPWLQRLVAQSGSANA